MAKPIVSEPRTDRRYTIDSLQLAKQHKRCTLIWTAEVRGREGARKDGGWEGGSKESMGGIKGREGYRGEGSDDARASVEEMRVE